MNKEQRREYNREYRKRPPEMRKKRGAPIAPPYLWRDDPSAYQKAWRKANPRPKKPLRDLDRSKPPAELLRIDRKAYYRRFQRYRRAQGLK